MNLQERLLVAACIVNGIDYEYAGMHQSKPKYYSAATTHFLIYVGTNWYYSTSDDLDNFFYFDFVASTSSCPSVTGWEAVSVVCKNTGTSSYGSLATFSIDKIYASVDITNVEDNENEWDNGETEEPVDNNVDVIVISSISSSLFLIANLFLIVKYWQRCLKSRCCKRKKADDESGNKSASATDVTVSVVIDEKTAKSETKKSKKVTLDLSDKKNSKSSKKDETKLTKELATKELTQPLNETGELKSKKSSKSKKSTKEMKSTRELTQPLNETGELKIKKNSKSKNKSKQDEIKSATRELTQPLNETKELKSSKTSKSSNSGKKKKKQKSEKKESKSKEEKKRPKKR